jgi:hypothetical protein
MAGLIIPKLTKKMRVDRAALVFASNTDEIKFQHSFHNS